MSTPEDRRRYQRASIRLHAHLTTVGGLECPCEIVDFCPAGVFLALEPSDVSEINVGEQGLLRFNAPASPGATADEHEIRIEMRRVSTGGVGVSFIEPSSTAAGVLESLSHAGGIRTPSDVSAKKTKPPASRPHAQTIMAHVGEIAQGRFKRVLEQFFKAADNALLIAARDARTNREQQDCFDVQAALKKAFTPVNEAALETLGRAIATLDTPFSSQSQGPADQSLSLASDGVGGLSLVDKDEFESFLVVSEAIADLEPMFREELFALNARFTDLAGYTVDNTRNPVGPSVLCQCVSAHLPEFPASRYAVGVVYKSMVRSLRDHLPEMYREINRHLKTAEVLPRFEEEKHRQIKKSAEPAGAATGAGSSAPSPVGGGSAQPQGGFPDAGGGVSANMAPPGYGYGPPPGYGYGPPPAGAGFGYRYADQASGSGRGYPNDGESAPMDLSNAMGPPPGAGYLGYSTAPVDEEVFNSTIGNFSHTLTPTPWRPTPSVFLRPNVTGAYAAAQRMAGLRRQVGPAALLPEDLATDASASPLPASLSRTQLLSGLAVMPIDEGGVKPGRIFSADEISARLSARLGSEGASVRLDPEQADVMEIVADLLSAVVSDVMVSPAARDYLASLQFAIQRQALADTQFFVNDAHPARQVIDRVAQVGEQIRTNDTQRAEVEAVVARVREAGDSTAVFADAVAELDKVLESQQSDFNSQLQGVVEQAERQQALLRQRRRGEPVKPPIETALPPEWHRWLERARALKVGEYFVYNAGQPNAQAASLGWIAEDFESFLFVNQAGDRIASMPLQQVAMFLRRGLLKPLLETSAKPVERAVTGLVSEMHSRLEREVAEDALTHFLHLSKFITDVDARLADLPAGTEGVFTLVDLRGLRDINQTQGRTLGDQLLARFAANLKDAFALPDILFGRLSGDKLAMFMVGQPIDVCVHTLEALLRRYNEAGEIVDGQALKLRGFAGVMPVDAGASSIRPLIGGARALCRDVAADNPQYVFTPTEKPAVRARDRLEQLAAYLERALDRDDLVLTARSVLPLRSELTGCREIRLTVRDRQGRPVPADFASDALKCSGRRKEFDQWLLRGTMAWMAGISAHDDRFMVVPLSEASLVDERLTHALMELFTEYPVPPGKVCFLMRDEDVVANLDAARDLSHVMAEFGCRFALDQFGSGRSDYNYLRQLPLDFVVIRNTFVEFMHSSDRDAAMVRSIRELANFTGIRSYVRAKDDARIRQIAEGMEIDYFCANKEGKALETPGK